MTSTTTTSAVNSILSDVSESASYYTNEHENVAVKLESGQPIQAWIDYDGATEILNVIISPLSVPKPRPLISNVTDLSQVFEEFMVVGFSAATGKPSGNHYISRWSFKTNGVSCPFGYLFPQWIRDRRHRSKERLYQRSEQCLRLFQ